jgi:hypothetical protein
MSLILSGTDGLSDVDGSASTPAIRGTDTNTGIFFPAADTIAFAEGGAEVARFDSSGKLLIGASSATGQAGGAVQAYLATQGVDTAGTIFAAATDSFAADKGGQVMMGGKYRALGDYCSFGGLAAKKENGTDGNYAGYLQFLVSNNPSGNLERMRIDSSGRLLVGLSSSVNAGGRLQVSDGVLVTYFTGNDIVFGRNATSYIENRAGTSSTIAVVSNTNGVILNNGATSWSSFSDARLKDVIEPITNALAKVAYINPVIGKYKTDSEGTRRSFLIAQDVQKALPEAVSEQVNEKSDGETYLTVSYTDIIPLLVAAIQEQQAIITDLKSRIEALEAK